VNHTGPRQWLGVLLIGAAVAGCASPGGGASGRADVARCAAVLPLARDVVHGQGVLTLVRPVDRKTIDAVSRELGVEPTPPPRAHPAHPASPSRPSPPLPRACLVVYQGDYPAGAITGALSEPARGRYALIVLRVRHPAVVRVLLADRLPPSARRTWWHF
jgi:hypothetical protein